MKVLLATASLDEVRWALAAGLLDGVHTTPALLAGGDPREQVTALARVSGVPVHVSVHAVVAADVHREARAIARLHDGLVVHLPLVEDVIGTMQRLRADGVRVAAAFVVTAAQAVLAARAGASAVVVPLPALAEAGLRADDVLRDIRRALDATHADCDVIAEGPASPAELATVVMAGADAVAVAPVQLRAALVHPATDRCLDRFLRDAARHPHPWGNE